MAARRVGRAGAVARVDVGGVDDEVRLALGVHVAVDSQPGRGAVLQRLLEVSRNVAYDEVGLRSAESSVAVTLMSIGLEESDVACEDWKQSDVVYEN